MTATIQERRTSATALRATPAVQVADLVKTYPHPDGGTFNAVDGLSFEVGAGEVLGILGPNGAGKSTTLEIIEGLQTPTSGSTSVFGLDSQVDNAAMKTRIGVQLQASSYFEYLTLEELLNLFCGKRGKITGKFTDVRHAGAGEFRRAGGDGETGGGQCDRLRWSVER